MSTLLFLLFLSTLVIMFVQWFAPILLITFTFLILLLIFLFFACNKKKDQ